MIDRLVMPYVVMCYVAVNLKLSEELSLAESTLLLFVFADNVQLVVKVEAVHICMSITTL